MKRVETSKILQTLRIQQRQIEGGCPSRVRQESRTYISKQPVQFHRNTVALDSSVRLKTCTNSLLHDNELMRLLTEIGSSRIIGGG